MDNAVECFQQAAAFQALGEPDRFTLAMAFVRLGHAEEARSELTKLAQDDSTAALYPYWLGRIDYDQRRYQSAVVHLTQATVLDAKSARAWDSLGLAYDMQGKADEALKAYEEGAKANRQSAHPSPWPPHDWGAFLLRVGKTKEAESALREALQYDPRMQQAHYHLARALEKDGADETAISEYKIAMQQDLSETDACYSLALLYRKMQRMAEAEATFAEWRRRRDNR
jgi:tetratricopeptide (TPR) repeat protein